MQQLIDGLLEFSRVTRAEHNSQPVELQQVVDQVLTFFDASLQETGARIDVGPLPAVLGHETLLIQLLQNLISNALKFQGADEPIVTISSESQGKMCQITVRDNGIGIEPQYFDRIFQIFQRLHTRDEYPGTGIGLAICKKIVEHHAGRIWVESEPGRGTAVHFTIQTAQALQPLTEEPVPACENRNALDALPERTA